MPQRLEEKIVLKCLCCENKASRKDLRLNYLLKLIVVSCLKSQKRLSANSYKVTAECRKPVSVDKAVSMTGAGTCSNPDLVACCEL